MACSTVYGSSNTTVEVTGAGGLQNFVFPFGELLVGEKNDEVSVQFQYNYLDTQFDVNTGVVANGTFGVANSVAYVTAPAAGDQAYISSRNTIRYKPGHSGYIDFTLAADTSLGGEVYMGGFDTDLQNGFVIECRNNMMYFGFLKDGVEKGSGFANAFDIVDTTGINISNLNIYRIIFGYLGIANPVLYIKYNGLWQKLHEIKTEGKAVATHVSTPVFPVTMMVQNGATAYTGSWNGGVLGTQISIGNRGLSFPNAILVNGISPEQSSMKLTSTNVGTVAIFRSKQTYQGKQNNVKARLTGYEFAVETPAGNVVGDVLFQLVGVQTLSGAGTFTDINTTSSVIEYDHTPGTGASVNLTAGIPIVDKIVPYTGSNKGGSSGSVSVDAEKIGAFAYRGDTFAIIAKDKGGNGVTVKVTLTWEELF